MEELLKSADLFWQYPVITEKTFYQQNNMDPLYLGFPWATIIDKRRSSSSIYKLLNNEYKQNRYYTCCQHISFRKLIPLFKALKITVVYTPHKKIGEDSIDNITIYPCPLYAVNIEDNTRNNVFQGKNYLTLERPYWFSFMGGYQPMDYMSDIRKQILEKYMMDQRKEVLVKYTGDWHFNKIVYNEKQDSKGIENIQENHVVKTNLYNTILLQSRFSLCPSGSGPNSIRLWESLAVGSIPILISDTLELPPHALWEKSILRIPEKQLNHLEIALKMITPQQEYQMRSNCLELYEYFKNQYKV